MKYTVTRREQCYQAVRPIASRWGAFWHVDLPSILAICFVESGFRDSATNPGAISLGGAWGLMQVTASTGRDLARRVASYTQTRGDYGQVQPLLARLAPPSTKAPPPLPTKTLLDPDINLMLGTFYLARLLEEFNTFESAAAAYTFGPGHIRHFILRHLPTVESCPPRVRNYVAKAAAARELFRAGFTPWDPTGSKGSDGSVT